MIKAVLSLGGNMGDMPKNFESARVEIALKLGEIVAQSKEYRSEAWGFSSGEFLNQVIVCETVLTPMELLKSIWEIEKMLGRERGTEEQELEKQTARKLGDIEYAPRTMDIDILYYGDEAINTPLLTIPHPLIHEREFILEPLMEVQDMLLSL